MSPDAPSVLTEPVPDGIEGIFTLMFSDVEGSTELWELHPDDMEPAILDHHEIVSNTIGRHRGRVLRFMGDGSLSIFPDAADGVAAGVALQRACRARSWPGIGELRIRI